jgi:hypothetical protein
MQMRLEARELMRLTVKVDPPKNVGRVNGGTLQVIPIVGGKFQGPGIEGKVLPGGADWNTQFDDGGAHVWAKYVLETNDGECIVVENEGFIKADSHQMIKTMPKFTADQNGKYANLNGGVYVGSLEPSSEDENTVDIIFYQMN